MTRISTTIVNLVTKRAKAIILLLMLLLSVSSLSAKQWNFTLEDEETGLKYRLSFDDNSWKIIVDMSFPGHNDWHNIYETSIEIVGINEGDYISVFDQSNTLVACINCATNGSNREMWFWPQADGKMKYGESKTVDRNFLQQFNDIKNWINSNVMGESLEVRKSSYAKSQKTTSGKSTVQSSAAPDTKGIEVLTFKVKGVSFDMVKVEGGPMGTYCIGKTEVTQALWKAVMGINPSKFKGEDQPVETVSWVDCRDFIAKLNKLTGKKFRMPTQAEWEYAARGGNRSKGYKYSGSDNIDDVAWYYTFKEGDRPRSVGQKMPNELGIYDMSGNVNEWCSDLYVPNFPNPQKLTFRVYCGGSWHTSPSDLNIPKSSYGSQTGLGGSDTMGLRLALSL